MARVPFVLEGPHAVFPRRCSRGCGGGGAGFRSSLPLFSRDQHVGSVPDVGRKPVPVTLLPGKTARVLSSPWVLPLTLEKL